MSIDINQVDAQLKIDKEIKSFVVDRHDRKLKRVCEECGSIDKVSISKVVRKYLCKNCKEKLK